MRENPREAVNDLQRLGHKLREQLDMVGNLIYLAKLPNTPYHERINYLALTEHVLRTFLAEGETPQDEQGANRAADSQTSTALGPRNQNFGSGFPKAKCHAICS